MRRRILRLIGSAALVVAGIAGLAGCGLAAPSSPAGSPSTATRVESATSSASASTPAITPSRRPLQNAPTGSYDVLSGTKQGAAMDWIAPGVATVWFGGMPGSALTTVGVTVYNTHAAEYAVADGTLTPVGDPYFLASLTVCTGPTCAPEAELWPLVTGPLTFEHTSATTVTLSGSGIVLYLRARA